MATLVQVSVKHDEQQRDISELHLAAADGRHWYKRYHGNLFLLFDAQELGVVELLTSRTSEEAGHASLQKQALVEEAVLRKLCFDGPFA